MTRLTADDIRVLQDAAGRWQSLIEARARVEDAQAAVWEDDGHFERAAEHRALGDGRRDEAHRIKVARDRLATQDPDIVTVTAAGYARKAVSAADMTGGRTWPTFTYSTRDEPEPFTPLDEARTCVPHGARDCPICTRDGEHIVLTFGLTPGDDALADRLTGVPVHAEPGGPQVGTVESAQVGIGGLVSCRVRVDPQWAHAVATGTITVTLRP